MGFFIECVMQDVLNMFNIRVKNVQFRKKELCHRHVLLSGTFDH